MKTLYLRYVACTTLLLLLLFTAAPAALGYGVLSHQAVVDAAWETALKPLLLKRYPKATAEQLRQAHAHAYGGSIVQDMGYYPFGSVFFTDLVHNVRSGDFVENLLISAVTLNEYAFALGALAHYNADISGHPLGTNKAVAIVYPNLKHVHGNEVTYADDPVAHVKTEFGFDVLQVARGNYASEKYQELIGFEVSKDVLERAFLQTYGLELGDVFVNVPLAISSYRYTIRSIFPDLTRAAWQAKRQDIRQAQPGITRRQFTYRMSRASFHKSWGRDYERPNLLARFLAWVMKIAPKVGPLRPLAFKPPTPEAEKLFMSSFNVTVDKYTAMLQQLRKQELSLHNLQLDTGEPTRAGTYPPADATYSRLLQQLTDNKFKNMTPALQRNLLQFYSNAANDTTILKNPEIKAQTLTAIKLLRAQKL